MASVQSTFPRADSLDRAVLEALGVAVVAADEGNRVVYLNRSAERLLGWPAADLVGEPVTTIVPARLRDAHVAGFSRRLAARGVGGQRALRVPALRRDGEEIDVALTVNGLEVDGALLFVALLRDLRDLDDLERESEFARRLFGVVTEVASLDTGARNVLAALGEALGWDLATLWVPQQDGGYLRCMAQWHTREPPAVGFTRATRQVTFLPGEGLPGRVWATGEPAWLSDLGADPDLPRHDAARRFGVRGAFAVPVRDGGRLIGVIEVASAEPRERDAPLLETMSAIGGRLGPYVQERLTHEALEASRERLALALEAASMGVWEWSAPTDSLRLSPTARDILGLPAGEADAGSVDGWTEFLHPDDRDRVLAAGRRALRTGRELTVEHRVVRPDGRVRWMESRGRVFRDGGGHVIGMTGVLVDVTDRKDAEQERERLHQGQVRIAETLQSSLLPPRLPDVPGIDLACRYHAAGRGQVGGDFFDVFPLRGDAWGIAMGDVCGKGPDAAAVIAMVRHTLRSAAMHSREPRRSLEKLNAAMLLDADVEVDPRFCTLVFARLQPGRESTAVQLASGGHPSPLVIRRSGDVEALAADGMIVGAFADADFGTEQAALRPGDAVVFYTDGVTDARMGPGRFGERRLRRLLAEHAGRSAEDIAGAVHDTVLEVEPQPRDDIALLVLRVRQE